MKMRGAQVHLLRQWLPRLLPNLQQGSTLTIRSEIESNIYLQTNWRDDGIISLVQRLGPGKSDSEKAGIKLFGEEKKLTSMGRDEPHTVVELFRDVYDSTESRDEMGKRGFLSPVPDFESLIPQDESNFSAEYIPGENAQVASTGQATSDLFLGTLLSLEVPEKINLDCDLRKGGSISIENKLEGDVRIRTANGSIKFKKLRGHKIDIEALGNGNTIYSSDLIEAESLVLRLPNPGRFRAKRVHAGSCDIHIGDRGMPSIECDDILLDSDDGGAVCDISALYITGDANILIQSTVGSRQAVRVKSSHGHVIVHASGGLPESQNSNNNAVLPMVDLGGVNGSCEVFVVNDGNRDSEPNDRVSCRVHFDSINPESVSCVKTDVGSVHITMDRKVETDLRMLSCRESASVDIDTLLLDKEDEDFDNLVSLLTELDASPQKPVESASIQIKTTAFTDKTEKAIPIVLKNVCFVDGWVENKSAEPESRFDRRLRGDGGSVGKIRLDGASNQALDHFKPNTNQKAGVSCGKPLVAIVGSGGILIETLSWLGNIARRYGLDETHDPDKLGRTATRRGRTLESSPEKV